MLFGAMTLLMSESKWKSFLGLCFLTVFFGVFVFLFFSFVNAAFYTVRLRPSPVPVASSIPATEPENHRFRIVGTDSLDTRGGFLLVQVIEDSQTQQNFYVFQSSNSHMLQVLPATVQPATVPGQH